MKQITKLLAAAFACSLFFSCSNDIAFRMPQGPQGPNGKAGKSAFELWKEYYGKDDTATIEDFLADLAIQGAATAPNVQIVDGYWTINGNNTGVKAIGKDGLAPLITIGSNGNWVIDGVDTGKPSKGADGKVPTVEISSNGTWVINGVDTGVQAEGKDAVAPQVGIGPNGNWVINGSDTGVPARGKDGKDGYSPKLTIGANGNWFIDGTDSGVPASGKDGKSTEITIGANGNWFFNGEDSGIPATGKDGKDGVDGKDGTVITISDDGYWVIDGEKTDVKAKGVDGQPGVSPVITIDPSDGTWIIDGVDTDKPSKGVDGQSPNPIIITIDPETGHWLVDGNDTGINARPTDGIDGNDAPVVDIDPNTGNWTIGGQPTNIRAKAIDGVDGANGKDGADATVTIGADGYWHINGVPTPVKAAGIDGTDGINAVVTIDPVTGNWVITQDGTTTDTQVRAEAVDGKDAYTLWKESVDAGTMTNKDGSEYKGGNTWEDYLRWLQGGDASVLYKTWVAMPGNEGKTMEQFVAELFSCHCEQAPRIEIQFDPCANPMMDPEMGPMPDPTPPDPSYSETPAGVNRFTILIPAGSTVDVTFPDGTTARYENTVLSGSTNVYYAKALPLFMKTVEQIYKVNYTLKDGTTSSEQFTIPAVSGIGGNAFMVWQVDLGNGMPVPGIYFDPNALANLKELWVNGVNILENNSGWDTLQNYRVPGDMVYYTTGMLFPDYEIKAIGNDGSCQFINRGQTISPK